MRNSETERLGGREIENEIELAGLLDRDIAGLRPAQNLVDQLGGAPEQSRIVRSVGHESPVPDDFASNSDRWQARGKRKYHDAHPVGGSERIAQVVKCVRLGFERLEGGCNILRPPDFEWRLPPGRAKLSTMPSP